MVPGLGKRSGDPLETLSIGAFPPVVTSMEMTMETDTEVREDGLQLAEHRSFQEWFWKLERVAWALFGAVTVAATMGFAGAGGWFASATTNIGGAEVKYPLTARWERPTEMEVSFPPSYKGPVSLSLGSGFLYSFSIEDVQPKPFEVVAHDQREEFHFRATSGGERKVVFTIKPKHAGKAEYAAEIAGSKQVLWTWIWP